VLLSESEDKNLSAVCFVQSDSLNIYVANTVCTHKNKFL